MSIRLTTAALLTGVLVAATASAQAPALRLPRASQNASVSQTIGTTDLAVKYCRPGVKGRAIWGALVPYDKPWRTGANEVTSFTTSDDITVEGQPLPAGTYGLVTIPGATTWTVVFSKQKEMWGAYDYDPKQDQLRVTVTPQAADMTEWMQFGFDVTSPTTCELALRWEKLRVPVRIAVDVNARVLASARAAVSGAKPDDWRTRYNAANWAFGAEMVPDETAKWANDALALQSNFQTLSLSAKLMQRAGKTKEAIAQMQKAIVSGKADKGINPDMITPAEKLLAEWQAKK